MAVYKACSFSSTSSKQKINRSVGSGLWAQSDFYNVFCFSQIFSVIVPVSSSPRATVAVMVSPVFSNWYSPCSNLCPWCSLQHWSLNTLGSSCPLYSFYFFFCFLLPGRKSACAVAGLELHAVVLLSFIGALILVSPLLSLWFPLWEINFCNSNSVKLGWNWTTVSEGLRENS